MDDPIETSITSDGLNVKYENSAYDHRIQLEPAVSFVNVLDDHFEYRFPKVRKVELVDENGFRVLTTKAVDVQIFTRDGAETIKIIYRNEV